MVFLPFYKEILTYIFPYVKDIIIINIFGIAFKGGGVPDCPGAPSTASAG